MIEYDLVNDFVFNASLASVLNAKLGAVAHGLHLMGFKLVILEMDSRLTLQMMRGQVVRIGQWILLNINWTKVAYDID